MAHEIKVPPLGESITEATLAQWYKKVGDAVAINDSLCELETDKVSIEVPAQIAGVLSQVAAQPGDTVAIGALLGAIDASDTRGAGDADATPAPSAPATRTPAPPSAPQNDSPAPAPSVMPPTPSPTPSEASIDETLSPAVRHLMAEHGLVAGDITGTGKGGRITKADVVQALDTPTQTPTPADSPASPSPAPAPAPSAPSGAGEERVKMSRLRQTIARRLKDAQNTAAQLTTFNEVDMSALMDVRRQYKDLFERKYNVRLGFMGFFARACAIALQEIPTVNAEIQGDEIIYKHYVHMGIAVGTDKGLVVPVVRDVQTLGLAEIEHQISTLGQRAREGALALQDLQGGTFTISNGGVYGSLMSTPILNMPQSGILGMHKIQDRPVAVDGAIAIRPMMYLALSYDHRIVDGKEAVGFLVRVKESLETPERMLLDI